MGRKAVLLLAVRSALATAHGLKSMLEKPQVRVVHRDVKPANLALSNGGWAMCDEEAARYEDLLVVPDGNLQSRVKSVGFLLIDYGLSQGALPLGEVYNPEALVLPAGIQRQADALISAPFFGWGTPDT
jgi:hypothetical protein